MVALLIDILESWALARRALRWWLWVPLAMLLGIVSSVVAHIFIGMALLKQDAVRSIDLAIVGTLLHAAVCVALTGLLTWRLARRKQVTSRTTTEPSR